MASRTAKATPVETVDAVSQVTRGVALDRSATKRFVKSHATVAARFDVKSDDYKGRACYERGLAYRALRLAGLVESKSPAYRTDDLMTLLRATRTDVSTSKKVDRLIGMGLDSTWTLWQTVVTSRKCNGGGMAAAILKDGATPKSVEAAYGAWHDETGKAYKADADGDPIVPGRNLPPTGETPGGDTGNHVSKPSDGSDDSEDTDNPRLPAVTKWADITTDDTVAQCLNRLATVLPHVSDEQLDAARDRITAMFAREFRTRADIRKGNVSDPGATALAPTGTEN